MACLSRGSFARRRVVLHGQIRATDDVLHQNLIGRALNRLAFPPRRAIEVTPTGKVLLDQVR